jgi:hypothetical protein
VAKEAKKEIWFYDDIHRALRKAALTAVEFLPVQPTEIPWDGPVLTSQDVLAGSYNVDQRLSAEGLELEKRQGRDALDAVLTAAFNLGMEQGLRYKADNVATDLLCVKTYLAHVQEAFDHLHKRVSRV